MPTGWSKVQFEKDAVNAAGDVLAGMAQHPEDFDTDADVLDRALIVVNNWRLSHAFPLNTFQSTLRRKAQRIYADSLTAQRLKRLRAIRHKLQKRTRRPISLWEMQDIGGCRAVLRTVEQVKALRDQYLNGDLKHKLVGQDDYIGQPRFSGYRGVHLIYSYYSDKATTWNNLKIEVQLRTQMQHAWATAVEIVGFFRQELLKSSEGDHAWKRFFKLMANDIAMREKSPLVPGMPTSRKALRDELRRCVAHTDALNHLHTFGQGMVDVQEVETNHAHWFLLELDTERRRLKITGYQLGAKTQASEDYATIERESLDSRQHDAVLVSVQSVIELKRAYTNYFLDMRYFTRLVEDVLGYKQPRPARQLDLPFATEAEMRKIGSRAPSRDTTNSQLSSCR